MGARVFWLQLQYQINVQKQYETHSSNIRADTLGSKQVIISDNGGEFKNGVLEEACEQLGIEHRTVASHSPQTNGFIG